MTRENEREKKKNIIMRVIKVEKLVQKITEKKIGKSEKKMVVKKHYILIMNFIFLLFIFHLNFNLLFITLIMKNSGKFREKW